MGAGTCRPLRTVESLHDFQQMDLVGLCKPGFAQPMVCVLTGPLVPGNAGRVGNSRTG